MKHPLAVAAALAALALHAHAQLVINEVRIDDSGSDDFEYVELYNAGAIDVTLNNLTYVVIGDGATGSGTIEDVIALPATSLAAGAYHVISNQGSLRIDSDSDGTADITALPDQSSPLQFENSDNVTHLLVTGFTGADNDDLDTDDDGILDVTPWTAVVDAIGLVETPTTGDKFYGAALGFTDIGPNGNFVPAHAYRSPDGGGWNIGAFGSELESPPGSGILLLQGTQDTPTVTNPDVVPLTLTIAPPSVAESAGFAAATGTVSRPGTSGDLEVTITGDDDTEAMAPISVFILDGQSSAPFDIDAVDDLYPDGTQTVTFEATAPAAIPDTATLEVTDDAADAFSLVINEIHAVPDFASTTTDINGDGTVNNDDEFLEIVNVTGATIDLTGFTIRDQFNLTHIFRDGTRLDPGCAILVFSGRGNLALGTTAAFGNAEVQVASEGTTLRLSNGGDRVLLLDDLGREVHGAAYGNLAGTEADGSLNLNTDKDGSSGYGRHGTIVGAAGAFSPGFFLDGLTRFCTVTPSLTVSVTPGNFAETASASAAIATITLPAQLAYDLHVQLFTDDATEAVPGFPDTAIITAGNLSAMIPIDAVDDPLLDGDQIVTVSALGSGFLNGATTVTVTDAGDTVIFTDLVINEVDADQPFTDTNEFIELYNLTGSAASLSGLVLVLINGNGDTVYNAFDLSGQMLPANGYLVVGNPASGPAYTPGNFAASNAIQNGADAVALYVGTAADFPNGTAVTAITNTLVDAVVYGTDDADDLELIAALGGPQVNEGPSSNTTSSSRVPDGTGSFVSQAPTPGAANVVAPAVLPDILFIFPDFAGGNVIMNIANLSPGVTYTLESSVNPPSNAGEVAFGTVTTFTTADGLGMGGVFQFAFADASIGGKAVNIYRVSAP